MVAINLLVTPITSHTYLSLVSVNISENASPTPVAPHLPAPTRNDLIIRLYQINTDKCTHIVLSHHFIKTTRHSKMLQPSKRHLHAVYLIHSSSKFKTMSHQMYNSGCQNIFTNKIIVYNQ
jgi:hypothetical protein